MSSASIRVSSSFCSSSSLPLLLHPRVKISNVLGNGHLYLRQKQFSSSHLLRLCSFNSDHNVYELPEFQSSPLDQKGTAEKNGTSQTESPTSNTILTRLRRYGVAGVLSYGLLNTAYYLTTFLIVWFYVAPSPGRMGYLPAVERFLKVMAMVWAGSQVTKLIRAGGALALAPFVDRGLSWFTTKMKFKSQGKAFAVVAGFCFGLAFMLFLIVTLLWA
ncbi:hypothetical protein P3L10_018643 [Capsicum annuum]|uniref:uncharacterized protein LOC107872891 n=1 Tax=Capsicum annuum TaxID=4072 RepID=UPI0007BEE826|nr:uncharacterized protein LOC107872891 [Capsicum annuum]XP_016575029.1 uncharacterized protein LOC107872891 [Capsicum annuum]XP_016575030.1 uncharacterized protein LOC107872891 [Capsicum annuum]